MKMTKLVSLFGLMCALAVPAFAQYEKNVAQDASTASRPQCQDTRYKWKPILEFAR